MADQTIYLKIRNREKTLFEDNILSITSENDRGTFDILPLHANFISLVRERLTIKKTDGQEENIEIDRGVLRVEQNKVYVYLASW